MNIIFYIIGGLFIVGLILWIYEFHRATAMPPDYEDDFEY